MKIISLSLPCLLDSSKTWLKEKVILGIGGRPLKNKTKQKELAGFINDYVKNTINMKQFEKLGKAEVLWWLQIF